LRFPARAKWEFNEIRRRRRKKRKRVVKFIMNQMQCEWMNEMEETKKKWIHFMQLCLWWWCVVFAWAHYIF
jgi:hypothetical protein